MGVPAGSAGMGLPWEPPGLEPGRERCGLGAFNRGVMESPELPLREAPVI